MLLDGFDLGVGILYGFAPDTAARNTIMNSIAPIWDGNETWLVLGGLGLLAAFPLAFAIIIPAVYFPILVMLLALVFRGVAFEFRFRDAEHKTFWDHAFNYGSGIATFAQGVVLGSFIQGFQGQRPGVFRQLVRFPDALLDPDRHRPVVRLWAARRGLADSQDRRRYSGRRPPSGPRLPDRRSSRDRHRQHLDADHGSGDRLTLVRLPEHAVSGAGSHCDRAAAIVTWRALHGRAEVLPFVGGIGLFALSYTGNRHQSLPDDRAPSFHAVAGGVLDRTQAFLLVGTLLLLPVILMYTSWSYWVFRGKVRADIGYH